MTGPVFLDGRSASVGILDRIGAHLDAGGLLAYPTETVYGLGAVGDESAVRKLSAVKARAPGKPFLLLLPDPRASGKDAVAGLEEWGLRCTPAAGLLVDSFWPGPLTLVLSDPQERFSSGVRNPDGGVAVRLSSHPFVAALLERWRHPLLSTSANLEGESPAATAREVAERLAERPGFADLWIVDGGNLAGGVPSTLVDCTGDSIRVLREGAISAERIRAIVPGVEVLT